MGCSFSVNAQGPMTPEPHTPSCRLAPPTIALSREKGPGATEKPGHQYLRDVQVIPTICGSASDLYGLESKELGHGACGTVCRGIHSVTGAVRAIKAVRPSAIMSPRLLRNEIAILMTMDHPNVIRLYEVFQTGKCTYLAMELCKGGELLNCIIQAAQFSEHQAALVMRQVLRAVAYLHGKDVCHRDLKPQNFLLLRRDRLERNDIKLIDFGFACVCKPGDVLRTRAGTAPYVAPQVVHRCYDKRCDVWSAGVTLFAVLSGQAPFTGKTTDEILERICAGRFSMEGPRWKHVCNDAKSLVRQLITLEPAERLTAEEALQHVWLERNLPPRRVALDKRSVERLCGFRVRNKLESMVLKIAARHLDEDKVKDQRAAFEAMDSRGTGRLTMEDMRHGLAAAGFDQSSRDLQSIFSEADLDGSGEIDYSELLVAMLDRRDLLTEETLWAAFQVLDRDRDGHINQSDMEALLYSSVRSEPQNCYQAFRQLLSEVDLSGDGVMSFAKFQCVMQAWGKDDALKEDSQSPAKSVLHFILENTIGLWAKAASHNFEPVKMVRQRVGLKVPAGSTCTRIGCSAHTPVTPATSAGYSFNSCRTITPAATQASL